MSRGETKYFYQFSVMGKGRFPFDMLRYDQCFPMSGEDAESLEVNAASTSVEAYTAIRTVRLCVVSHRNFQPTEGRWASFGWPVVRGSFEEV